MRLSTLITVWSLRIVRILRQHVLMHWQPYDVRVKEGVAIVNIATLNDPGAESVLRYVVSDEELEAAAEEIALSYTFQTSQYNLCCK